LLHILHEPLRAMAANPLANKRYLGDTFFEEL
jgi:hypothetical protein